MADIDPQVNIEQLHADIEAAVKAQFPAFKTVEFYRDDEDESVETPACLLQMIDAEPRPEDDAGTGQFPAMLRFEAFVILAHRGPSTRMEVRKAATALATWLYQRRHFPPADPVDVLACEREAFRPANDKYQVWRVEFAMLAFLGESAWNGEGAIPTDVRYSWSPQIGTGNEQHYENVLSDQS